MKFTKEQKEKIVLLKGFRTSKGYCMGYEVPEDSDIISVFITEEEWKKASKRGCQEYYYNSHTERMLDLEEAWDFCLDEIWDDNECKSDDELNKVIKCLLA